MATATGQAVTATGQPQVTVLVDRCAGCQECVIRCPTEALSMDFQHWVVRADEHRCIGCRQCVRTCPFAAITVGGPLRVADRRDSAPRRAAGLVGDFGEIHEGFSSWEEAIAEAQRCVNCPDPTCVRGCPAHNDIPAFIEAIRARDLAKGHEVLRRTSVLPDICSRVCNQAAQCEGACTWSLAGGPPVAIGRLERFIADHAPIPPPRLPSKASGLSVGVVGAGPAGIGASWELREAGASVTVYEKDAVPGGLLDWGIPRFTLPRAVASRPWEQLVAAGVDLRCNTEVSPEVLEQLLATHEAVILAHGATLPMRLKVPGTDLEGVTDATVFLRGAREWLAERPTGAEGFVPGAHSDGADARSVPLVLVLGAGNTAMDVARTARRLGFRAVCVDWLDERFALVRPDELHEAREEGVEVRFSRTLVRLDGDARRVRRALLAPTRQRRPNRSPKVLRRGLETLDVDLVVMAMGYRADPGFVSVVPATSPRRSVVGFPERTWLASGILAGPASGFAYYYPVGALALAREEGLRRAWRPARDRVWVAGDALVGPSTVVEAMAQGRRSAQAVIAAFRGTSGR